ncbi:MAG: hypothetical protein LBF77_06530 [Spirochaetaceae bacterium]|jgi:hypothetical protein|nr:hypothetical protein [Spirochaetaceae bacterium]
MTEEAKLARLWSGFHRLSANDRILVLSFAETISRKEEADQGPAEKPAGRELSGPEEKV